MNRPTISPLITQFLKDSGSDPIDSYKESLLYVSQLDDVLQQVLISQLTKFPKPDEQMNNFELVMYWIKRLYDNKCLFQMQADVTTKQYDTLSLKYFDEHDIGLYLYHNYCLHYKI